MTVTHEGRVVVVCDCCKEQFFADGGSIGEVWQQASEQGWVKTVSGNHYCAPCAIGMRQK
jgi:hypothetical protein